MDNIRDSPKLSKKNRGEMWYLPFHNGTGWNEQKRKKEEQGLMGNRTLECDNMCFVIFLYSAVVLVLQKILYKKNVVGDRSYSEFLC